MSGGELLVVVIAILALFGGKRLPELARAWGRTVRNWRRMLNQLKREAGWEEVDLNEPPKPKDEHNNIRLG